MKREGGCGAWEEIAIHAACCMNSDRTRNLEKTQFLATYLPPEFALLRNGFSAIPMPAEDTPIAGNGYHTGAGKTLEAGSRGRRVGRKVYYLTPQPLPPEPLEPKWPTETKNQRQIRIQSAILDARYNKPQKVCVATKQV